MTETELDEILTFYWPLVIQRALTSGNKWAVGFAKGIAKKGRNHRWKPSERQADAMRMMVDDLRVPQPDAMTVFDDKPLSRQEAAIQRVRTCFLRAETIKPMGG